MKKKPVIDKLEEDTTLTFAEKGLKHIGLVKFKLRKKEESDYDYIKRVLEEKNIQFIERLGDTNESFIILYDGKPTIEMTAIKIAIHEVSLHRLPSLGLSAFEFYEEELQSF